MREKGDNVIVDTRVQESKKLKLQTQTICSLLQVLYRSQPLLRTTILGITNTNSCCTSATDADESILIQLTKTNQSILIVHD
jgi:hypothetical protein